MRTPHQALKQGGLQGALGYLNSRTMLRFTAIYRFEGQMVCNIFLYDRLGENPTHLVETPLGESFCQFVLRDQGFSTFNSAGDTQLPGHPYQGVLNSYFGLPLSRKAGTIYGIFCHFDTEPMEIPDSEIPLLEAVSVVPMEHLD